MNSPGLSERRQLINVAYRLLGSLADAEDAVQEAYARWYGMTPQQQEAIENPGAWLTKVASRICLTMLASARARRERYVGEWIPEPLPEPTEWISGRSGATAVDPADRVTLDESVSMAFLVVLELMTPAERVAFILHDVFRYPFAEVAEIVGRTTAACRQLATSARRRIRAAQAPATPTYRHADIVRDFKAAWEAKDIDALIGLLDPDTTSVADGGGLAIAFLDPIHGGKQVARASVEIAHAAPHLTLLERTVNGQPGLIAQHNGVTVTVYAFDIAGDRIKHIWASRVPASPVRAVEHEAVPLPDHPALAADVVSRYPAGRVQLRRGDPEAQEQGRPARTNTPSLSVAAPSSSASIWFTTPRMADPPPRRCDPLLAQCVHLVEDEQARAVAARRVEDRPQVAFAVADPHVQHVAQADLVEPGAQLAGQRPRDARLAAAGRTPQQTTAAQ